MWLCFVFGVLPCRQCTRGQREHKYYNDLSAGFTYCRFVIAETSNRGIKLLTPRFAATYFHAEMYPVNERYSLFLQCCVLLKEINLWTRLKTLHSVYNHVTWDTNHILQTTGHISSPKHVDVGTASKDSTAHDRLTSLWKWLDIMDNFHLQSFA